MDKRKENFKRIAVARTKIVLSRLRILGNCANRSHYAYTEQEINKIFLEIERKVRESKARFTFPKREDDFNL